MRKSQLIALILVAIMAVAVIPAAAVAKLPINSAPAAPQTAIVGQTRTPTLTVGWVPMYPTRWGAFTVWERLTWGTANLPNKPIWIYWKYPWEYTWHYYTKKYTSTSGYVQFSDSDGYRAEQFLLKFPGDSVYYPVSKQVTVLIGGTSTSAFSTNYNPAAFEAYNVYGYVKDANGKGIAGVPVRLWWQAWDSTTGYTPWNLWKTLTTDANGMYSANGAYNKWVRFQASFEGYPIVSNSPYWESSGTTPWIDAR